MNRMKFGRERLLDGSTGLQLALAVRFLADAVSLLIDVLLCFLNCKRNRVFSAVMSVGAHEAVLFDPLGRILLDRAGSLIDRIVTKRRRQNAIALVFSCRRSRRAGLVRTTGKAAPEGFESRKHLRWTSFCQAGYHIAPRSAWLPDARPQAPTASAAIRDQSQHFIVQSEPSAGTAALAPQPG